MRSMIYNAPIIDRTLEPRVTQSLACAPAGSADVATDPLSWSTVSRPLSDANQANELHGYFSSEPQEVASPDHSNQQYSITAVTTSAGAIAERYAYSAYGEPTLLDGSGSQIANSSISNRYSYTGREWDATVGLYHFRARWMSPKTGRFLTRDPIGYKAGPSQYEYVVSGPLHFVDPDGLKCRVAIATGHTWNIDYLVKDFGKPERCDYFAPMCCNTQVAHEECKKKGRDIVPGLQPFPGLLVCKASEKVRPTDRSVEEEFPRLLELSFDAAESFCDPESKCKCTLVEFEIKCHLRSEERDNNYPTFAECLDKLTDIMPFNVCRSTHKNGTGGAFFYDCKNKTYYKKDGGGRPNIPIDPRPKR